MWQDGKSCFGVVVGDGVVTMNGKLGYPTLRDALAVPTALVEGPRQAAKDAQPDHKLTRYPSAAGIPNPEKILCAGINYRSHAAETGRELPKQPSMFVRLANTLTGHEGEMIRPSVSEQFDFEGELAVVIGRGGRHIPVERALEHVAGYTCFVDGSVRDYQKFSVTSGKNFPGTGPLGPWIVTADEIPDPDPAHANHPAQRAGGAEFRHRPADLFGAADHRVLLGFHAARAGRRHRDRNTGGGWPSAQSAAMDEAGRCSRSRDFRDRHSAQPDRGRADIIASRACTLHHHSAGSGNSARYFW